MEVNKAGPMIKELRAKKAWTQEDLAAAAGISPRTVQRAEEGQMSADTLKAIAAAFGIPVENISAAAAERQPRLTPVLYYEEGDTLDWIADVFGWEVRVRIPDPDGRILHAELYMGDARIMVGSPVESRRWTTPRLAGVHTQSLYVIVDNVDGHYQRARSKGAEILSPPEDMHGERRYLAQDPEGHHWWFATPTNG